MTSQDDLTLLKQMYQRGEITDEQYDVLRRHVLWGTPLPELIDEPPAPVPPPARSAAPRDGGPAPPVPRAQPPGGAGPAGYDTGQYRVPPAYRAESPPPAGTAGAGTAGSETGQYRVPPAYRAESQPPAGAGTAGSETGQYRVPPAYRAESQPPAGTAGSETGQYRVPPAYRVDPRPPQGGPAGPETGRYRGPAVGGRAGRADRDTGQHRAASGSRVDGGAARIPPAPRAPNPALPRDLDEPLGADAGRWPTGAQPTGSRRRRGPRLIAVLTSVLLAVALAGAGVWWFVLRQTAVPPSVYAQSICTAVRDWQRDVDARSTTLTKDITELGTDHPAIRTAVAAYYSGLTTRTDALRGTLVAAGTPDVVGGKEYAESLARAVGDQTTSLRGLAQRAGELDVTASRTVFQIVLNSLLTNTATTVTDVAHALAEPPAGTPAELSIAMDANPICAPFVG